MTDFTFTQFGPRESTLEFLKLLARTYCPVQCDLSEKEQKLAY